jgi:hypothetical protein
MSNDEQLPDPENIVWGEPELVHPDAPEPPDPEQTPEE